MRNPTRRWWSGETIRERYQRIGGFTSGFDYLRLVLATGVVVQHSIAVTNRSQADALWEGPWRMLIGLILPMFFALSGFLVTASLLKRPSIASFATLRAVRLLPALIVEVVLSALILGPLVTTLPLSAYFTDPSFFKYFLNVVGRIHFHLPGVFTGPANAPMLGAVNQSLWTIPFELECYLLLIGFYLFGLVSRRRLFVLGIVACMIVGNALLFGGFEPDGWRLQQLPLVGRALVVAFLCGAVIQLYADRIRLAGGWAVVSAAAAAVLLIRWETSYLAVIPAAYLTVYLGMLNPRKAPLLFSGDYSYGLYLFAFPIQQTCALLVPQASIWYVNAGLTLVLGLLYAGFSWWCVEKPILSRKKYIVAFVERHVNHRIRLPEQIAKLRNPAL